ncbi:hypothetical protein DB347_01495 [Opitutaceae bacterium EW11]|nr:hypothetical protein DB347_01495 [Opitutaceae bacterium EW11]
MSASSFRPRRILYPWDESNARASEFIATFPDLYARSLQITKAIADDSHDVVCEFAEDFYEGYRLSSGALTESFTATHLVEVFRLLKPYFPLARDSDAEALLGLPADLVVYRGGRGPIR